MIESAKSFGADATKFQMFTENEIRDVKPEIHDKLARMILNRETAKMLKDYAEKVVGIEWFCLKPGSEIIANPHIIPIENIIPGTKVLSHTGTFEVVTKNFMRHFKGKLVSVKTAFSSEPVEVTPNHLILAIPITGRDSHWNWKINRDRIPKAEWIPAGSLKKGDFLAISFPNETHNLERIDLTRIIDDPYELTETMVRPPRYPHGGSHYHTIPRFIQVSPELLRLIGYYLAEGSIGKNTLVFSFSQTEQKYIEDVSKLIKTIFGINKGRVVQSNIHKGCQIIFSSQILSNLFSTFGQHAKDKTIPLWIINLPTNKTQELIAGYWRGDGYFKDLRQWSRQFSAYTASASLAVQLRFLLFRLGIISRLKRVHRDARIIRGRSIPDTTGYELTISGEPDLSIMAKILAVPKRNLKRQIKTGWIQNGHAFVPIKHIDCLNYVGPVYNLEIKNSNSYTSMWNATLHNCTPMNLDAVDILEDLGVKRYKIRFKDNENFPLMRKALNTNKQVMISTSEPIRCFFTPYTIEYKNIRELYCVPLYPPKISELGLHHLLNKGFSGYSCHLPDPDITLVIAALLHKYHRDDYILELHVKPEWEHCIDWEVSFTFPMMGNLIRRIKEMEG